MCAVSCTASSSGQWGTCYDMQVYSGAGGAEVTCTEVNSKRTIVRVSYQHVPLTPEGNAEIEALDEGEFRRDIQGLRNLVMPLLNAA